MRLLARALLLLPVLSLLCTHAFAQTPPRTTGAGTINGHISVGDKPGQGIIVIAVPGEQRPDRREAARAVTDYEGNYSLTGLPAGRFNVVPVAPNMIVPAERSYGSPGSSVILGEGETVEKIDFSLTRAGVITGRITDADGKPVIEERLQLTPADNSGRFFINHNPYMLQTDDRGVYRLFGVAPGRYKLSVGISPDETVVTAGNNRRRYYPRTFYPGETDPNKAGVIEVAEGGEVKEVNIKVGRPSKSFAVAGRVVDAETGRPVPNLLIGYGGFDQQQKTISAYSYGQFRTNSRGEFRLEAVLPGRFAAFTWSDDENYSEPVPFEVTDADVSGLEIKIKRGATIMGVVQLEGVTDKNVMAKLLKIALGASVQTSNLGPPDNRQATITPDGSFRLTGLPPGRVQLFVYDLQAQRNIRLLRVERDGVAQPNGIEVGPGAQLANVRVVFEYGNGSIAGEVRFENGTPPEGTRIYISVHKAGEDENSPPLAYTQSDARGRFVLDGLVAGDYQVIVRAQVPLANGNTLIMGRQNVTVSNGSESQTTVILDLKGGYTP